jgi:hypothetical protein
MTSTITMRRKANGTECRGFFSHEKLDVYREAIAFAAWLNGLSEDTSA